MPRLMETTLVLIPALDEAESIGPTIQRWQTLRVGRVRVVDNGSSDGTAKVAAGHGAEVLHEAKRGYGAAAWRGLQELPPTMEWVLFSSGDGSDRLTEKDLEAWEQCAAAGYDLIIGDRVTPAPSREHLKSIQSFGNSLCCHLIRLGWGRRFKDMGSLRLVRLSALDTLQLKDRSFGWNIEMQVRAIEHGLRIIELPVSYHPRTAGRSKISGSFLGTCRAGASILSMTARLWLTRRRTRRTGRA